MTKPYLATKSWQRPEVLLILMAIAMPISFSTWMALINNFAIEEVGFDGSKMGNLQSIREIPGFLSFGVVFLLIWFREQPFAMFSLILLGLGAAVTGFFPSVIGLYLTTVLMSIGFHYYETLHQSLSLQWTTKDEAPIVLGRIVSARSFASIISFLLIFLVFKFGHLPMSWVYVIAGGITIAMALFCWNSFPRFESHVEQSKKIVLRTRYWLWYALVFMSGARRQIFVVFAGFLMVEKFGFSVEEVALLYLANAVVTMFVAPQIGKLIRIFGERRALIIEYVGLACVFTGYAFAEAAWVGVVLFMLDHMFFAMAIALKTYFQKIANPEDIASSSGVSFTISHIVAVILPAAFGYLWLVSPSYVFLAGTGMALVSLALAVLIPRNPTPDNVAIVGNLKPVAAE